MYFFCFKRVGMDLTWSSLLSEEKKSPYFCNILQFINEERNNGKIIFPKSRQIFDAFRHCTLSSLKVVILGQDPYHGINQANGLAFSVTKGTKIPPSLSNIYQELYNDLHIPLPNHGCLISLAKQGVLLLNSVLTVELSKPNSHACIGWQNFTDTVVKKVSSSKKNLVFMLWGRHAQKKRDLINEKKHAILTAPHPSPFSANRGFLGCKHFSKANQYLQMHNISTISWNIK